MGLSYAVTLRMMIGVAVITALTAIMTRDAFDTAWTGICLLYTSPSPRD